MSFSSGKEGIGNYISEFALLLVSLKLRIVNHNWFCIFFLDVQFSNIINEHLICTLYDCEISVHFSNMNTSSVKETTNVFHKMFHIQTFETTRYKFKLSYIENIGVGDIIAGKSMRLWSRNSDYFEINKSSNWLLSIGTDTIGEHANIIMV